MEPSEPREITAGSIRELLTVEQMLVRVAMRCDAPIALELNVDEQLGERWEISWYCIPRPEEPQDLEYGGHWYGDAGGSLYDLVAEAYRHVFPDMAEPS